MTTESQPRPRAAGGPTLRTLAGSTLAALALGVVLVVLAGVLAGAPALAGAAVGVLLAVAVLAAGTLTVALVATTLPAASLLVALLTYVLQVLVLGLVFVALSGSGALEATLDRTWLGVGLVAITLTWSVAQVRLATTARIPAFDLTLDRSHDRGLPAVDRAADAGAR